MKEIFYAYVATFWQKKLFLNYLVTRISARNSTVGSRQQIMIDILDYIQNLDSLFFYKLLFTDSYTVLIFANKNIFKVFLLSQE